MFNNEERNEQIKMLITFVQLEENEKLEDKIIWICNNIMTNYDVKSDLFVFKKCTKNEEVFITFKANIPENSESVNHLENTKFINWKPQTNTFFTINALNYMILGECGEKDLSHKINWNRHKNKLIMLKKSKDVEGRKNISEFKIKRYARIKSDFSIYYYPVRENIGE